LGYTDCPHFSGDEQDDASEARTGQALPWSGLALGSSDLLAVTGLNRVRLVGLVGAANAGKTTALAAMLLTCRRGDGEHGEHFAGSYTLSGWHSIARRLQWIPHGSGFPAHTTSADARTPALLHLALKPDPSATVTDVLYTDVPGEWFTTWAYDASAPEAAAAQWIADNADAFLLFADSAALAGPDRGLARGGYDVLAQRLRSAAGDRPVLPFLSKADIAVPARISAHIESVNGDLFGGATRSISVVADAGEPLTAAIDAGTTAVLDHQSPPTLVDAPDGADPFMAYRSSVLEDHRS